MYSKLHLNKIMSCTKSLLFIIVIYNNISTIAILF